MKRKTQEHRPVPDGDTVGYDSILAGIIDLLETARRASARAVNVVMTATYWQIGRQIVEFEQGGAARAEYGKGLMKRLAADLTCRFGRGFSLSNLKQFKQFYLVYREVAKSQTASGLFPQPQRRPTDPRRPGRSPVPSATAMAPPAPASSPPDSATQFPLPWSHYVRLVAVANAKAREFYEAEALRNGWTVRQLERQISTLFYERTLASRDKAAMLRKGAIAKGEEELTPEEEIKDPLVLEFLGLKDEYSESELEEALIRQLESFLLELGGDFAFVGRQRRLRIDDEWYRIDLLFYHRRLRCLVVIDLKLGKLTHADVGQMHLYLNYARAHWTHADENPPVGVILCTQKGRAVVHYALEGLPNKVLAAEYRTKLPDEATLVAELERTRRLLEARPAPGAKGGGP